MMQQFGLQRLTKYSSPIDAVVIKVVQANVLLAFISGADTSSFPTEQVELGRAALGRIEKSIEAAESIVSTYLLRRYDIPLEDKLLAANLEMLKKHTNFIARYLLAAHKPSVSIKAAYDTSISYLDDITNARRGGLSLGDTPIVDIPPQLDITPPFSLRQARSSIAWQKYR
jgi:phage gp36-like protein